MKNKALIEFQTVTEQYGPLHPFCDHTCLRRVERDNWTRDIKRVLTPVKSNLDSVYS